MTRTHLEQIIIDKDIFESWHNGENKYFFDDETWEFLSLNDLMKQYEEHKDDYDGDFSEALKYWIHEGYIYSSYESYGEMIGDCYEGNMNYIEVGNKVVLAIALRY